MLKGFRDERGFDLACKRVLLKQLALALIFFVPTDQTIIKIFAIFWLPTATLISHRRPANKCCILSVQNLGNR